MSKKTLKIGTRSSALALTQARMVESALKNAHSELEIEIVPVVSKADWKKNDPEVALDIQNGGKGQFAKEIEELILAGEVDCGVHSLKDMDSFLPEGLVIDHVLPRAKPNDAFISKKYKSIEDLPAGATLGTCSPRRSALALMKRPDLQIVPFRGNVRTRLDKIEAGQVDASYLAMAGLERLGIHNSMIHKVPTEDFLPACGQGIVCIERRINDLETAQLLDSIHHAETGLCAAAERAVLRVLGGSCHTPIAAHAVMEENKIYLRAMVSNLDGSITFRESLKQTCDKIQEAVQIGETVGSCLKSQLPEGFLNI